MAEVKQADLNRDGLVSFLEFLRFYELLLASGAEFSELAKMFYFFDADGSGELDQKEVSTRVPSEPRTALVARRGGEAGLTRGWHALNTGYQEIVRPRSRVTRHRPLFARSSGCCLTRSSRTSATRTRRTWPRSSVRRTRTARRRSASTSSGSTMTR